MNLLRVRLSANLGAKATDAVTGKRQGDVPQPHLGNRFHIIVGDALVIFKLVSLD